MLPERPLLPGDLLRDPARRRRRGADERAAEGARGRLLPRGPGRQARCSPGATSPRRPRRAPRRPAPRCILVKPGEFEKLLAEQEPDTRGGRPGGRGHRRDPLHVAAPPASRRAPSSRTRTCTRTAPGVSEKLGELSDEDVLLGALPLFHSFGQTCTMNSAVCVGATVTMLPRFDPDKALEIIERDKVTHLPGRPDDVQRDAALRVGRRRGLLLAAHLHVGRRGDARPS